MGPGLLLEPEEMTPEQRLDALAEVLAEGFLHVAARGELSLDGLERKKVGSDDGIAHYVQYQQAAH